MVGATVAASGANGAGDDSGRRRRRAFTRDSFRTYRKNPN